MLWASSNEEDNIVKLANRPSFSPMSQNLSLMLGFKHHLTQIVFFDLKSVRIFPEKKSLCRQIDDMAVATQSTTERIDKGQDLLKDCSDTGIVVASVISLNHRGPQVKREINLTFCGSQVINYLDTTSLVLLQNVSSNGIARKE